MYTLILVLVYLTAINLGLPDSLLGVSWPQLHDILNVGTETLGIVTLCVTGFSILMSFFSGKIIKKLGHGKVIAFSVTLTGSALLAISFISNIYLLILFSLPLGMGGGAIDAAMNDYVAKNYSSRQMNFLHCFWGVGATAGPLLMSGLLAAGGWRWGYRIIAFIQAASAVILFICMPLWSKGEKLLPALTQIKSAGKTAPFTEREKESAQIEGDASLLVPKEGLKENPTENSKITCEEKNNQQLGQNCEKVLLQQSGQDNKKGKEKRGFFEPFKEKGVIVSLFSFFFYCGIESCVGNWGATYLVSGVKLAAEKAAVVVSFYYGGITAGRFLSALISNKTGDKALIVAGIGTLFCGIMLLIFSKIVTLNIIGYLLIGLGCAPLFPSMVHLTPRRFDKKFSADIIGFQIAFAGVGVGAIPPLAGFILKEVSFAYFPYILVILCAALAALQLILNKLTSDKKKLLPL